MSKTIHHLSDLTPDPQNARRHNPRNVGMIESALGEVGAARSIVIDENGVVLAGNATIEAAAAAGIERVQVVEADGETIIAVRRSGLTAEQKTKLALYDNRAAELADWDASVLAALGEEIDLSGLFRPDEIGRILDQAGTEAINAADLWKGMPEFEQEDQTSFRSIHVHFKCQADIDKFAELVGQKIGERTRSLWYPEAEKIDMYSELYVNES